MSIAPWYKALTPFATPKYRPARPSAVQPGRETSGFPQFFPQVWKTLGGNPNRQAHFRSQIAGGGSPNVAQRDAARPDSGTPRRAVRIDRAKPCWLPFEVPSQAAACTRHGRRAIIRGDRGPDLSVTLDEANVSAQQPPASPDPRLPRPDADEERPDRAQEAPREGAEAPHRFHQVSGPTPAGGVSPGEPAVQGVPADPSAGRVPGRVRGGPEGERPHDDRLLAPAAWGGDQAGNCRHPKARGRGAPQSGQTSDSRAVPSKPGPARIRHRGRAATGLVRCHVP